jgi:ABC-2 type transport system ATP-binding protein
VSQATSYTLWQLDHPDKARQMFADQPDVQLISNDEHQIDETLFSSLQDPIVTIMDADQINRWVNKFVVSGIGVHSVQRVAPTLEELFLKLTEGETIG